MSFGGSREATEGECVNIRFYKAPRLRGLLPSLALSLVTPPSRREALVRFALNKQTDKSKFEIVFSFAIIVPRCSYFVKKFGFFTCISRRTLL